MSTAHFSGRLAALPLLLAACTMATAQQGIILDHDFGDWSGIPSVAVEDTAGPLVMAGFSSDAENLYFHLIYDRLIALDEGLIPHGTKLGVDIDGDAGTGQIVGGFQGADIVVHLQDRYVNESQPNGTTEQHSLNDRWVRMAPTYGCLLYTSPSPRDQRGSRMPSSA